METQNALEPIDAEILDALLEGDIPLPHLLERLLHIGYDKTRALEAMSSLSVKGLVQFHERENALESKNIRFLPVNQSFDDILSVVLANSDRPEFGVESTSLGYSVIESYIKSETKPGAK